MMYKEFAKDYDSYNAITNAIDDTRDTGNITGLKAAREAYNELMNAIQDKGSDYAFAFRLYSDARKRGNGYIDLSDPYQYRDAERLLAVLRNFGFHDFTFSSDWSSAVETAWEFCKLGCTLEGMVEIYGATRDPFDDYAYVKVPAYLFKI